MKVTKDGEILLSNEEIIGCCEAQNDALAGDYSPFKIRFILELNHIKTANLYEKLLGAGEESTNAKKLMPGV